MSKNQISLYNNYDELILKCVPSYNNIIKIIVDNIQDSNDKILDLGIGTGNLENFIFTKFPQANVLGIDISTKFTNIAKIKHPFKKLGLLNADIKKHHLGRKKFATILSALTIHHFEDNEKIKLFENIYKALKKDGLFINFDMIQPKTKKIFTELQIALLKEWRARGLTENFIKKEVIEMKERDRLVKLSKQKKWLEEIGFTFSVIYEDGFFCVYKCKK